MNRGRRNTLGLHINDALDFWKVADLIPNKRLLLLAQRKLPDNVWLEFDIQQGMLVQTAHCIPHSLLGRLYWYAVLLFHSLVFPDLCRQMGPGYYRATTPFSKWRRKILMTWPEENLPIDHLPIMTAGATQPHWVVATHRTATLQTVTAFATFPRHVRSDCLKLFFHPLR